MPPRRRRIASAIGHCFVSLLIGCGPPASRPSAKGHFSNADVTVLPHMLRGLKSKNPSIRARSAATIGGMGPAAKEAVPMLIASLKDRDTSVRAGCIFALGQIGPDARIARPNLEAMTKQAPLRDVATKALRQIDGR